MRSIIVALSIVACASASGGMAESSGPVPGPSGIDVSPACQPTCDAFDVQAVAPLNPTVRGPSTFAQLEFEKGINLLEKEEFARASVQLSKAANREKSNAVFQYWAGGSHFMAGNSEAAELFLSRALQINEGLSANQETTARKMIAELKPD